MGILVGLAVALIAAPCLATGAEDAALGREQARRLIAALEQGWPGWTDGAQAAIEENHLAKLEVLDRVVAGGKHDLFEADVARRIAGAFERAWVAQKGAPPRFGDGQAPAPEEWARKALVEYRREEAALLLAALEADDAAQARRHGAAAARIRFRRVAALTSDRVELLRSAELREGLGLFMAQRALELSRGAPEGFGAALEQRYPDFAFTLGPRLGASVRKMLSEVASGHDELYSPELSGCAIALVLERIRPGWWPKLRDESRSLDSLLIRQARPFGS